MMHLTFAIPAAEAARAGIDHCGTFDVPVFPSTLSPAARAVLADLLTLSPVGGLLDGGTRYRSTDVPRRPVAPTPENVPAWIESVAEAVAAAAAEQAATVEAAVQHALAQPESEWIFYRYDGEPVLRAPVGSLVNFNADAARDARVVARREALKAGAYAEAVAEWSAKVEAARAAHAAAKAAAEAEAERVKARKRAQVESWLAEKAPEALRKRHARGLLPESDVVGAMKDATFAALDDLPRYLRMTADEVRAALGGDDDDEVRLAEAEDATTATDEQIALMESIEARLPGATTKLREHCGYIERIEDVVTRYGVAVTLVVGEWTFVREYAA